MCKTDRWLTTEEQSVADLVEKLLDLLVPDDLRDDQNFDETPKRVASAFLNEWCSGYAEDPEAVIKAFENVDPGRGLVMVKDIQFYSMCAHHLAPFKGMAMVAYVPNGKVLGLSKTARLLEVFARRFQLQERITNQVADALMQYLEPQGCMIVLYNVEHMCMTSRGVEAHQAITTTSAIRGIFENDSDLRHEVLSLLTLK